MPADRTEAAYALEHDEIITAIQGIEDRIAAFAANQELQLEDLRQTVGHLQLEQRQAEAEIALYGEQATSCASEALARADEALQRLAALAAASQVREIVGDAELPDSLPAGPDVLAGPLQAIEERLALFFGQHETRLEELRQLVDESVRVAEQRVAGPVTEQGSRLAELRQLVDQVQQQQLQVAAEAGARGEQATTRASEALARADEALPSTSCRLHQSRHQR